MKKKTQYIGDIVGVDLAKGDALTIIKKYKKIEFSLGSSIAECVGLLIYRKELGELAYGDFNGVRLFSDSVTMDSAYTLITGKTKAEYDEQIRKNVEDADRRNREYKEGIPELSKIWIDKGRKILANDKWELWKTVVPIRLDDLYNGMELGCCLDIVEILNNGGALGDAKRMIENQGHSGISFGLVCSMVSTFSYRGEEFCEFVK